VKVYTKELFKFF